jgi:hypothetical protein
VGQALDDKETLPLEIRKFCFDIRMSASSSFGKNNIVGFKGKSLSKQKISIQAQFCAT